MVVSMDDRQTDYAQSVTEALRRSGVRAMADLRNEKVRHKIREHSQHVPYLVVIGEKEKAWRVCQCAQSHRGGFWQDGG